MAYSLAGPCKEIQGEVMMTKFELCAECEESEKKIAELETENERLKAEVRRLNVKLSDESNRSTILAEKLNEINHSHEQLRKENAKIRCLALHAISEVVRLTAMVSRMFTKTKGIYGHWYNPLLLTEGAIQSAYDRARR